VGESNPRKPPSPAPNSPHGPQTRPRGPRCTRTGLQNLPTAKQICSGEKLREFVLIGTLAAPDHELPGPASGGLARQCPPEPGLGRRQMSPGEHTQTPGATPRKDSRILKNQPQVNERPRLGIALIRSPRACAPIVASNALWFRSGENSIRSAAAHVTGRRRKTTTARPDVRIHGTSSSCAGLVVALGWNPGEAC